MRQQKSGLRMGQVTGMMGTGGDGMPIDIPAEAWAIIMDSQKRKILENHTNKITQGPDGRWRTYVPKEGGGRHLIALNTREAVEARVVDHYTTQAAKTRQQRATLATLYPAWTAYKTPQVETTTLRRYDDDWRRCYADDPISTTPVADLTRVQVQSWAYDLANKSTKTDYNNIMTIMRQVLDYAGDLGIIDNNPARQIRIPAKRFRRAQKTSEAQIFRPAELIKLEQLAEEDHANHPGDTTPLAIRLGILTGLRRGELVALRWTDIDGQMIHVQRMEGKHEAQDDAGRWLPATLTVVDHAKTDKGNRWVPLTEEALDVLARIKAANARHGYDEDYIFVGTGGRTKGRAINSKLRKYCRQMGQKTKNAHIMRKTFVSILAEAGDLDDATTCDITGHADIRITRDHYTYSRRVDAQKVALVAKAMAHRKV